MKRECQPAADVNECIRIDMQALDSLNVMVSAWYTMARARQV